MEEDRNAISEFLKNFLSGKGTYLVGVAAAILGAYQYYSEGDVDSAQGLWVMAAGLLGLRRAIGNQ